jgi:hypothetical protein
VTRYLIESDSATMCALLDHCRSLRTANAPDSRRPVAPSRTSVICAAALQEAADGGIGFQATSLFQRAAAVPDTHNGGSVSRVILLQRDADGVAGRSFAPYSALR